MDPGCGWLLFGTPLGLLLLLLLLTGPVIEGQSVTVESANSSLRPVPLTGERAAVSSLRALRVNHGWLLC
jgi:hypothetical protein